MANNHINMARKQHWDTKTYQTHNLKQMIEQNI